MKIKFLFIYLIIIAKLDDYENDDDPINKNTVSEEDAEEKFEVNPNYEDILPMYYKNQDNSSDSIVHSNRVLRCEDHSGAKNVCSKANSSLLCYEKETYAFSFCRKSCKFCEEIDSLKHSFWRIVAGTSIRPTWAISELNFYHRYPVDKEPINTSMPIASNSYPGYSPDLAFDNLLDTYWMPNEWGNHDANTVWVGGTLESPGIVNAIKINVKNLGGEILPSKIHVESTANISEPFIRRWSVSFNANDSGEVIVRPSCPPLWNRIMSNETTMCAKIFGKHVGWNKAKEICDENDANLISFESLNHLLEFKRKFYLRGPVWIGLNDRVKEGDYIWQDGSKQDFFHWENGLPVDDLRNQDEDCVYINSDGYFQTASCQNRYFFACHKPYNKFAEIKIDSKEPNVFSPILFAQNNFYDPILNTTDSNKNFTESRLNWMPVLKVPIYMNQNTTFANRFEKQNPSIIITDDVNDILMNNNTIKSKNHPEKEKNEQPAHRYLQKRKINKKIM